MNPLWNQTTECIVFEGKRWLAEGELGSLLDVIRVRRDQCAPLIVLEVTTNRVIDLDSLDRACLTAPSEPGDSAPAESVRKGPGRPALGVVSREVTLLPRHWDWLRSQSGGASVALRRLVEQARKEDAEADRVRELRDSAYRFMAVMAGHEFGFEGAARALFSNRANDFERHLATWPPDIREHALRLAARVWQTEAASAG